MARPSPERSGRWVWIRVATEEVEAMGGWVIYDLGVSRPYLPKIWRDQAEAEADLEALVRPYPVNHMWRKRLILRPWPSRRVP